MDAGVGEVEASDDVVVRELRDEVTAPATHLEVTGLGMCTGGTIPQQIQRH